MLVIGIDGGGTKTVAQLTDASRLGAAEARDAGAAALLGTGTAGPSNQRAVGPAVALQNLQDAVAQAFASASLSQSCVAVACLGLAGADRESDRGVILEWAHRTQLAAEVVVVNDALPLLYAPAETSDQSVPEAGTGIALICGTGSLAFGRNANGQTARSGGWGYLLGDEGSAYWIGREALQAVVACVDGRAPQTALVDHVQQQCGLKTMSELVPLVYGAAQPRTVIAQLAASVFSLAAAGDVTCRQILNSAAQHLCLLVTSLADRLQVRENFRLVVTGGVLLNQPEFRSDVLQCLQNADAPPVFVQPVYQPVQGAVQMAAQIALTGRTIP